MHIKLDIDRVMHNRIAHALLFVHRAIHFSNFFHFLVLPFFVYFKKFKKIANSIQIVLGCGRLAS